MNPSYRFYPDGTKKLGGPNPREIEGDYLTGRIDLRTTPDQKVFVMQQAALLGIGPTAYLRRLIDKERAAISTPTPGPHRPIR